MSVASNFGSAWKPLRRIEPFTPAPLPFQRPPSHCRLPSPLHDSVLWYPLHRSPGLLTSPAAESLLGSCQSVLSHSNGLLSILNPFSPKGILPLWASSPTFPLLSLLLHLGLASPSGRLQQWRRVDISKVSTMGSCGSTNQYSLGWAFPWLFLVLPKGLWLVCCSLCRSYGSGTILATGWAKFHNELLNLPLFIFTWCNYV